MTIERRLEVFGIPVHKKKLPIGTQDVLRKMNGWNYTDSPITVAYEDIYVESPDSLVHRQGHYQPSAERRTIMEPVTNGVRYEGAMLNEVDIERGVLPGIKIVYRWTPSQTSQQAA